MNKIKDYLLASLGAVGYILYFIFGILLTVYPLMMFDMPWGIYLILAFIIQFFLINIPFCLEILWIVGLFGAISGKQDVFAIIYYVIFAVIALQAVVNLVRVLKNK